MSEEIKPFKIHVSDAELDDLKRRLRAARLPEKETLDDWSQGVPLAYVKDVRQYWAEKYAWRKTEARLNALPQFRSRWRRESPEVPALRFCKLRRNWQSRYRQVPAIGDEEGRDALTCLTAGRPLVRTTGRRPAWRQPPRGPLAGVYWEV